MTDTTSQTATTTQNATTSDDVTTDNVPPALVVACSAYAVTTVDGRIPTALVQFTGPAVFVVEGLTGEHLVWGQGSDCTEGTVRFYEKDNRGTGKDVRVWTVSQRDAGFIASC